MGRSLLCVNIYHNVEFSMFNPQTSERIRRPAEYLWFEFMSTNPKFMLGVFNTCFYYNKYCIIRKEVKTEDSYYAASVMTYFCGSWIAESQFKIIPCCSQDRKGNMFKPPLALHVVQLLIVK